MTPRGELLVRAGDVNGALVTFGSVGSIPRGGTLVAFAAASGSLVGVSDAGRFTLTPAASASASASSPAL
jgi:hypothetical protein